MGINTIHKCERCNIVLKKVPARVAQLFIGFLQGSPTDTEVTARILSEEGILLTDRLFEYMYISIGEGVLPLSDKNIDDLDITFLDLLQVKMLAIENMLNVIKNVEARNIQNSLQSD